MTGLGIQQAIEPGCHGLCESLEPQLSGKAFQGRLLEAFPLVTVDGNHFPVCWENAVHVKHCCLQSPLAIVSGGRGGGGNTTSLDTLG